MDGGVTDQGVVVIGAIEVAAGATGALVGWRLTKTRSGALLGLLAGLLVPPAALAIGFRSGALQRPGLGGA